MTRPSLRDLDAFAAVAAHRSFEKAAASLGVSRSGLSHTLIGLERALGVRLLHRTTRSVSPTDAGARLLERLRPVLRDLGTALDGVAEARGEPGGRLRINTVSRVARMLLAEIVPRFLALHPLVELEVAAAGRLIDIVAEGYDAGVRLLDAVPQDMIAVPFGGAQRFIAVAGPEYLAHAAPIATPDDLRGHRCIRHRLPSGKRYAWEFGRHGEELVIDAPGVLTLDDPDLMVEAAARGLGIAYVAESHAADALAAGTLLRVLDDWCPPGPPLALYYPGNRHVPSALRAFIDVLKQADRAAAG